MRLFNEIERLQYSVIYWLYKTKFYKSGKGYIYRANQLLALSLAAFILMILFILLRMNNNLILALIFIFSSVLLFYLLECNVKRNKMFIHRIVYKTYRKRVLYFFIFNTILLALIIASYLVR
jgi:hypothetical protein